MKKKSYANVRCKAMGCLFCTLYHCICPIGPYPPRCITLLRNLPFWLNIHELCYINADVTLRSAGLVLSIKPREQQHIGQAVRCLTSDRCITSLNPVWDTYLSPYCLRAAWPSLASYSSFIAKMSLKGTLYPYFS